MTALTAALVVLLLDGGTSPYTLLASTSILLLATLARWCHYPPSTKAGCCMALFLLLAFITVIPLPSPFMRINGSKSAAHHALADQTLSESFDAGLTSSGTRWSQISRNRAGTMRAILLLSSALLAAALVRQLPQNSKKHLLLTIGALAALAGVAGLISIFILPQHKSFWWLIPVPHGRPLACFINANHFASFMAVSALLITGMACRKIFESSWISLILLPALALLMTFAVLVSSSTGAFLAFGAGILAALLINIRKHPVFVVTILLILTAGLLTMPLIAGKDVSVKSTLKPLLEPDNSPSVKLRLDTWKDSLSIIKDYPVFGTGLNAFRTVFPQHRTSATRKEHDNVENEYIQIPVESGFVGTSILLAALLLFIRQLSGQKDGTGTLLPVIIPALVVAAAHCLVDFPIRIPLYSLVCAVLLGLCTPDGKSMPLAGRRQRPTLPAVTGIAAITVILSLFQPHRTFSLDNPEYLQSAASDELAAAVASSPSYWCAYYNLGRQVANNPDLRPLAERQITEASLLNPLNYKLLLELAQLRLDMGHTKEAAAAYQQAKQLRPWLHSPSLETLIKTTPQDP